MPFPYNPGSICKLFLGGLAPSTDTAQLQDYFSQFGTRVSLRLMGLFGEERGFSDPASEMSPPLGSRVAEPSNLLGVPCSGALLRTLTDVVAMTVNGQPRGFGFVGSQPISMPTQWLYSLFSTKMICHRFQLFSLMDTATLGPETAFSCGGLAEVDILHPARGRRGADLPRGPRPGWSYPRRQEG